MRYSSHTHWKLQCAYGSLFRGFMCDLSELHAALKPSLTWQQDQWKGESMCKFVSRSNVCLHKWLFMTVSVWASGVLCQLLRYSLSGLSVSVFAWVLESASWELYCPVKGVCNGSCRPRAPPNGRNVFLVQSVGFKLMRTWETVKLNHGERIQRQRKWAKLSSILKHV